MKKVLFIDRDGTLIIEPEDEQIDSFEKLEFYPGVFQHLARIAKELEYELVMVTNQDGLGTSSFPEETFWPVHNMILKAFENEGVRFSEVLIDRSFPHENLPTRKPGTGMVTHYMQGNYDLENSFVIGDRMTDVQLANNMGCRSILLSDPQQTKAVEATNETGATEVVETTNALGTTESPKQTKTPETKEGQEATLTTTDWGEIYRFLKAEPRKGKVSRATNETRVTVEVNLDGSGKSTISTGLGFFDHMLEQIARHGNIDLTVLAEGDLHVDEHHTIEDVGIALGEAFNKALGNKKGLERYGFLLPMDDCLAQVAIDFGGRPWLVWNATFLREFIGDMPTEMCMHFFKSFSDNARCNLNIEAQGENEHHKMEAIFKAFARAIRMAVKRSHPGEIPSTKGIL
ncbi:MAG TPA: bifunctional histidinol-phosphatase/imidazoleglycerol-phosphate dehydratase HisB [Bacteroidales bacterium]|jgi:imidazoleglycerol-phosphate dehydratase/histidinol-phosphatase|nr:bifunctional histidinol-phosphatase/imidazoleglycerol-phosphate dehydratase HisB [Bacteroidales bacterium]